MSVSRGPPPLPASVISRGSNSSFQLSHERESSQSQSINSPLSHSQQQHHRQESDIAAPGDSSDEDLDEDEDICPPPPPAMSGLLDDDPAPPPPEVTPGHSYSSSTSSISPPPPNSSTSPPPAPAPALTHSNSGEDFSSTPRTAATSTAVYDQPRMRSGRVGNVPAGPPPASAFNPHPLVSASTHPPPVNRGVRPSVSLMASLSPTHHPMQSPTRFGGGGGGPPPILPTIQSNSNGGANGNEDSITTRPIPNGAYAPRVRLIGLANDNPPLPPSNSSPSPRGPAPPNAISVNPSLSSNNSASASASTSPVSSSTNSFTHHVRSPTSGISSTNTTSTASRTGGGGGGFVETDDDGITMITSPMFTMPVSAVSVTAPSSSTTTSSPSTSTTATTSSTNANSSSTPLLATATVALTSRDIPNPSFSSSLTLPGAQPTLQSQNSQPHAVILHASPTTPGHSRNVTSIFATAAVELGNSTSSFASSLTHNYVGVSAQVEVGSYCAKRCSSFLRKLAMAQEEYSRNIQKILQHEQTKLMKLTGDHMFLYNKSWLQIQELYSKLAKNYQAESTEISNTIVSPLVDFYTHQEDRRREIASEERKITAEMSRAREDVNKNLHTCQKLLDEAKKLQLDAKEEARKLASSGEKNHGFFKSLSMKVGRKPETVIKEAGKAASVYQASIVTANKRQQKYLESDLPKLFNDMQSMEKKRLDTLKQRLLKFHSTAHTFAQERSGLIDELKKIIDTNNSSDDMVEFISEMLYEHGPSVAPRPFSYELPCSPGDIEQGRLEGNPNSIFRTTVEHCMELQAKFFPTDSTNSSSSSSKAAPLDIPRIIPSLITRIRELNGYRELGIFRISVGKEDLDALRKQIDTEQNYNLGNVKNPHICAALMKEWLRLLVNPLIPSDPITYNSAVDSVKGFTGANINTEGIMAIYNALPTINQRILKELSLMVKDISEPTNAEISKMTVENLAIVFAPSFLRNPSEDPLKLLENTKFETKFTASLFRVVAGITW